MGSVWDTDTVSEYLQGKNPHVMRRGSAYLKQHPQAPLSIITRYEILRGLKAKGATTKRAAFEVFWQQQQALPITDAIITIAADLWAGLYRAGQIIGDNDILIAATALRHGLAVATGNVAHFSRIPGLTVEDWTKP